MSRQRSWVCVCIVLIVSSAVVAMPARVLAQSSTPTPTNTPTLPPSSTPTPTTTITATAASTATITNTPTITLTPTPFPPPTLVSPNDGATIFETQPTLQWSLVNGSVFYSVQVSQTNTFATVINNGTTTNTQYIVSAPLAAGVYYWRVGSWSGVQMVYSAPRVMILVTPTPSNTPSPTITGTPNLTQTSIAATLTALAYTVTPFPAPVLVSPSESASLPGAAISFVWGSVAGSSWYKIEVASDVSFTSYSINAWVSSPTTTYNSPSPLPIGLYYWRAGSWDGNTIIYSAPRSLTITANETATAAWQGTATVAALTATYTPSPTITLTPTQTPSLTPTVNAQATSNAQTTQAAAINTPVSGTLTPVALGGDVFENDDTPDAAKQIVIGESQQRTFYKLGAKDIDWAWVNLKPGLWRISARTDAGQLDPKLTVIWQGKEIAKGDDEDGKNAVVLVQATSQGRYELKVENLGVDAPNQFYSLVVEKVEIKPANVVPTARPPTARPSVKVTVRIFIDRNGDGTMGADEGVNQVLVVVSAGTLWSEQANTLNGIASFVIPSTIKEGTEVIVAAPYLHRTAKFKLPISGDVVSDVALPAPVLPVFIP